MASHCAVRRWVRGNLIGAGSFGKVSLAINMDNGELFAVKSIDYSDSTGSEILAIENELRFLQTLDSPHIIRCFGGDHTLENGVQMRNLFMEYMAGGSLADLMKKFGGPLDEALVRLYARGILEGLDYLHSQGVVHCDVKGKNILIGSSGVKIADLGSAKRLGQKSIGVKGTPLWMAPEVIMHVEQGLPSDIWSLGCTIVEMATGRPPWSKGLNLFAALMQIGGKEELPPLPDCLSAEGKDFLSKCLQRDPKQRWTSSDLLKHPFVQKKTRMGGGGGGGGGVGHCLNCDRLKVPSSPTSVLDVGGDTTGEWDSQSANARSVPVLQFERMENERGKAVPKLLPRVSALGEAQVATPTATPRGGTSGWITVRSPRVNGEDQAEDRQRPLSRFMLAREEETGKQERWQPVAVRRSAAQVNFDCLDFLRRWPTGGQPAASPPTTAPAEATSATASMASRDLPDKAQTCRVCSCDSTCAPLIAPTSCHASNPTALPVSRPSVSSAVSTSAAALARHIIIYPSAPP